IADPVPQAASVVGVTQLVPVRNFGKTGLSFPVLGIGTVWFGRQWPPDDSSYAYPEFDEVRNYLDGVFADLGNNSRAIMIDTAAAYGSTEEVIGKYFRERPDLFSKAFIATKWGEEYDTSTGKSDIDHSKERLIASTKRSLERLGKMDLLYIHGATLEVLSNGEVMEEMRRMKDVHYGGLSLIGASISREDVLEGSVRENLIEGLDVIQMPGSVFLNRPDLVNAIYEKGIAIVINSPIRKGDKRTPGAIYADLLGHRELSVILTGTRHHLRDNIEYCLPAPQAASAAAAEDEKLKGKGSPADLLELIKDTPELMQKALDWKGLGGITEQDIAKVRPYSGRTIRRELKTLDNLRILVQASRTGNYRFDRKMLGPDIDHTKTLINAINDIRYMAGKQGDERPMHRGAIDPSKMGTVKALVKMAVFKELNNGYLPAHEKDKILWHIIERGVIPREQGDTIVTQINKAFRDNDLPERIWILDENKNTSEAIAEIRAKFPNSIIDVALASKDSINKMPDDDQVKMLVFRGCHDFVQLEGVIAALRALHSQDALARLRHIYLIMTDHIFAGELPSASDSIKEFARKFAFDLPPAENAPINDIPELNKRLLALLTAA
ncbi:MAG: aldo/keto reductase, partial [Candidatus Omnitrophica bacterium]|nr:aldo/keto reductase [Candidatus Omnitrophota bacterium]